MKKALLLALLFGLACKTSQPAAPAKPPSQFKNLQVLSRDIQREDLLKTMRGFTRGLGVRCDFCHVATATTPKPEFDFPSDAKDEKRLARVMIQMTATINGTYLPRFDAVDPGEDEAPRVSCWTCHRGKQEPELPPPPPPEGAH